MKNKGNYKDGRHLKEYHCKDCGKEISKTSGIYGSGKCKSCSHKGVKLNFQHRKNIIKALTGRKCSKNTRKKIAKKLIGRKRPEISGKNNYMFKGRYYDSNGYILIWMPNHFNADKQGHILEHRLVMSKYLGRNLKSTEIVHHENEIKDDNRLSNLILCANRKEHLNKYHKNEARQF